HSRPITSETQGAPEGLLVSRACYHRKRLASPSRGTWWTFPDYHYLVSLPTAPLLVLGLVVLGRRDAVRHAHRDSSRHRRLFSGRSTGWSAATGAPRSPHDSVKRCRRSGW